jgi:hypothetical protein
MRLHLVAALALVVFLTGLVCGLQIGIAKGRQLVAQQTAGR